MSASSLRDRLRQGHHTTDKSLGFAQTKDFELTNALLSRR